MDAWAGGLGALTLFVDDLVFEDGHSFVLRVGQTMINVLAASEAPEVIAPVPVAPPSAGTRALVTVDVGSATEVDRVGRALRAAGVDLLQGPVDRPWGVRTVTFADLDGHVWEVAAPLG